MDSKTVIAGLIHDAIIAANNAGYQDARYVAGEITKDARDKAHRERDEANRALWQTYWSAGKPLTYWSPDNS